MEEFRSGPFLSRRLAKKIRLHEYEKEFFSRVMNQRPGAEDVGLLLGMGQAPARRQIIPPQQLENLIAHCLPQHADRVRLLHSNLEAQLIDINTFRMQV